MGLASMDGLFFSLAFIWIAFSVSALLSFRSVKLLAPLVRTSHTQPRLPRGPRVSILLAARNEERRIARTVSGLLDQTDVEFELIVVNDRSTDSTSELLSDLERKHPALKVVHVESLPDGWLGKPHALHLASEAATGEWLLFTDGDVWIASDVVARAIAAAREVGVQHFCLFPGEDRQSSPAKAALMFLSLAFGPVAAGVNRNSRWAVTGIGAFNLVRADAYRAVGGHRSLKFEVVDDVKLGLLLHRKGYRARVMDASREIKVRWAPDIPGLFHAIEKNMFAMFEFNVLLATAAMVLPTLIWTVTVAAAFTGSRAGLAAGLALASTIVPALFAARRAGIGLAHALLVPLMPPILTFLIGWSTFKTLRQGGIVWRDTFYPLRDLRRGRVPMFQIPGRATTKPD
jgi:glycosyltransferase involved in cell wall biosynthesis